MTRNVRRFAAIVSLTMVLSTPAMAATSRDGYDRERTPVLRLIKRILQKFIDVVPMLEPGGPPPTNNGTNP